MSKIPEGTLGKELEDYLLHDYTPDELPPDSLLQHLDSDRTIEKILAKDNATAATFYDLTRLALVPNRLLSLRGTQIIPTLMDLFRSYSEQHQPYEYEYGFHCVEAILFVLLIGVLDGETELLQMYMAEVMALPGPVSTAAFHDVIEQCLGPILESGEELGEPDERSWGFDPWTKTLVPAFGGFTADDLHCFVTAIWGGRKHMFWAHTITGVSALWRCGIAVLCLFLGRTSHSHELGPKLYNIALRLEFNSSEDEFNLLDSVIESTFGIPGLSPDGQYSLNSVVDLEDAKLMLRKYHPWVLLMEQRLWETVNLCVTSASNIVVQLNDLELHLEFLKSHLRVMWSGILRYDEDPGDIERATLLILFATSTLKHIEFVVTRNLAKNVPPCIEMVFTEGDFVNLMGRTLLWLPRFASTYYPHEEIGDIMTQLELLYETFIELARATEPVVPSLLIVTPRPFDIWSDWDKTLVFFQHTQQVYRAENNQNLLTYLDMMTKGWEEFGRMIPYGFWHLYCANPDCGRIDPSMRCARCCTMRYCNKRCQQR
ncbi:hypothetical protein FRC12_008311 [Ceratobasidium sp. 428]|nr:hypothetical protein FRC12_008311 [Ceratobasidium sp. 428]